MIQAAGSSKMLIPSTNYINHIRGDSSTKAMPWLRNSITGL